MTISSIVVLDEMGAAGGEATFFTRIRFVGSAVYADGGLDENALLRAAIGKNVTPVAIVANRTIAGTTRMYQPRIVQGMASVQSDATFPTADQDTKTILYKLNGGDEQTLTLSGSHTSAAHLAASMDAVVGTHAYVDGDSQVTWKTDRSGEDASIEITGGTANAVYAFPTGENTGDNTPRLMIVDEATGLDVGLKDPAVDLSGYIFECTLASK